MKLMSINLFSNSISLLLQSCTCTYSSHDFFGDNRREAKKKVKRNFKNQYFVSVTYRYNYYMQDKYASIIAEL